MGIDEIVGRNFYATKRRGQINADTSLSDCLIKLEEEFNELVESSSETSFDEMELADVVLVCFTIAKLNGINLVKAMEQKMLFNEKRND